MTPEICWKQRAACAHQVMQASFANGFGRINGLEARLSAALGDVLSRPGSLVRAVIAYLVGIEMGMMEEASRALACGIEYMHTASLIFDDLPAMDDARLRRGAPCVHVVHGEAVAMLAALALVNRGYAMLWQGMEKTSATRRKEAGRMVDECLGVTGLIGGQSHDLSGWRGEQDTAEVSEVAAHKTGDLLRLTLVLPALLGKGTHRELQLLDRLGLLRGLAYQAADDLKDSICHETESGKTTGRDEELGRPNLILAEGFQGALHRFKRIRQIGDRVQAKLPGPAERWGMLAPLRVSLPTLPEFGQGRVWGTA